VARCSGDVGIGWSKWQLRRDSRVAPVGAIELGPERQSQWQTHVWIWPGCWSVLARTTVALLPPRFLRGEKVPKADEGGLTAVLHLPAGRNENFVWHDPSPGLRPPSEGTGDIEDRNRGHRGRFFYFITLSFTSLAGAVGGVGNAGFIGVFQELWEDARFSCAAFHGSSPSIARFGFIRSARLVLS
jgi:hypothetical protein